MAVLTPEEESDIREKALSIIAEHSKADKAQITDDADFVKDLGMDSLDMTEVIMKFEDEFEIKIEDDAGERISNFGGAFKYIKEEITKKRAT